MGLSGVGGILHFQQGLLAPSLLVRIGGQAKPPSSGGRDSINASSE